MFAFGDKVGGVRALIVSNPNSTTQSAEMFRHVIPTLRAVPGLELRAQMTHYAGHARHMCENLTVEDYDVVIAVGGDGTVNEVINGLLGDLPSAPPALAVIPTGSANVFARALGLPADPAQAAEVLADALHKGSTRRINLGKWGSQWFAVNAGFGIDADVIASVERVRRRGFAATPLRYAHAAIRSWLKLHRHAPRMSVRAINRNGEEFVHDDLPIVIASNTNPWTFLGPLPVVTNPRNSFDLGLSLWAITDLRGIGGVASMAHLVGIGHNKVIADVLQRRTLMFDDATEVSIVCHENQRFQADGEYVGQFEEVTLKAVADAIEVYAPTEPVKPTPLSMLKVGLSFFDPRL